MSIPANADMNTGPLGRSLLCRIIAKDARCHFFVPVSVGAFAFLTHAGGRSCNSLRLQSLILVEPSIETPLDGLRVSLERSLAPADIAGVVGDFDKEPVGRDPEIFHGSNSAHNEEVL